VIDAGLELPELAPARQEALNRAIPEYGSSVNPVDLSADVVSRADILHGTLAVLREDRDIDVWLVFGRPIVDRYSAAFIEFARARGKVVIVSCGVPIPPEIDAALRAGGIPVLDDPALCLTALGRIVRAARKNAGCAAGTPRKITATIETDRDFGSVLALTTSHAPRRVVRALPADANDLRDALEEIAGMHPPESTIDRLQDLVASGTPATQIELDLNA